MMQYVAGLLFTEDRRQVLMIRKNRPRWQAGRRNAVGGKIETGETPFMAMEREFREETGQTVTGWESVAVLSGPSFAVHFFAAFNTPAFQQARTMEDEVIERAYVASLHTSSDIIPNLRVISAIALDTSGIVKPVIMTDSLRNPETGSPKDAPA